MSETFVLGLLRAIGVVATLAGARGVVAGASETGGAPPAADNEYRFYAAWYLVFGTMLLRRGRPEPVLVDACAAGFAIAAAGRVLGGATVGRPTRAQQTLLVIEVAIAAVLGLSRAGRAART